MRRRLVLPSGWGGVGACLCLPGRPGAELAGAMRHAEAAYGEHEKRTGAADPGCPDW